MLNIQIYESTILGLILRI